MRRYYDLELIAEQSMLQHYIGGQDDPMDGTAIGPPILTDHGQAVLIGSIAGLILFGPSGVDIGGKVAGIFAPAMEVR